MNCPDARERMLEAELAELRGDAGSELARHLHGCPECARLAVGIVEGLDLLNAELASRPSPPAEARYPGTPLVAGPRPRRRVGQLAVAATALAATLGGILLARPWTDPTGAPDTEPVLGSDFPPSVIENTGTQGAIVFSVAHPDITVIWLYEEDS